jgi:hypothetical protein
MPKLVPDQNEFKIACRGMWIGEREPAYVWIFRKEEAANLKAKSGSTYGLMAKFQLAGRLTEASLEQIIQIAVPNSYE